MAFFDATGRCVEMHSSGVIDTTLPFMAAVPGGAFPHEVWYNPATHVVEQPPLVAVPVADRVDVNSALQIPVEEGVTLFVNEQTFPGPGTVTINTSVRGPIQLRFEGKKRGEKIIQVVNYQDKRIAEYPPLSDQVEALVEGGQKLADLRTQLQAIKAKYPVSA